MRMKLHSYTLHNQLHAAGYPVTRSQVYELLAAAVGYASHAAFQHQAAWWQAAYQATGRQPDRERLAQRCDSLGLSAQAASRVVDVVSECLAHAPYGPVTFESLVTAGERMDLEDGSPQPEHWVWEYLDTSDSRGGTLLDTDTLLLEGLEAGARRGMGAAHLALATLLDTRLSDEEGDRLRRQLAGPDGWSTPYLSYAQAKDDPFGLEKKHLHHLLAAARAGQVRAMHETAERYGDPALLALTPSDHVDPWTMVELASQHGDHKRARYWLTRAAEEGSIEAMRDLLESEELPLEDAWIWMHLSRLLDHDLSRDRHIAIYEDGSEYDEDVGGPAYVGGEDGLTLPPLDDQVNQRALQRAQALFEKLEQTQD